MYNPGDKVRCIDGFIEDGPKFNKIYTVADYEHNDWDDEYFYLVEFPNRQFSIYDFVQIRIKNLPTEE